MRSVPEADKLDIIAFYEANKEVPFYWPNTQDDYEYEVCFTQRPRCRIDGRIDLWRIQIEFRQTAANTKRRVAGMSVIRSTVLGELTKTP